MKSFGSRKVGPSFVNSELFLFSTANASSTIDFSKAAIDEGIVDNFLSKEIRRTPLCFSLLSKELKKGWKL